MTTCETCGKKTNQPIFSITRKGAEGKINLPICRECYDKYRSRWDNEETERICRSTRKTKSGSKNTKMPSIKRGVSPFYISFSKKAEVWCGYAVNGAGRKIRVPGARSATAEKTARVVLDYCRKNCGIDEEQAKRYCLERNLPYSQPKIKER